jgi:hypothetical protein
MLLLSGLPLLRLTSSSDKTLDSSSSRVASWSTLYVPSHLCLVTRDTPTRISQPTVDERPTQVPKQPALKEPSFPPEILQRCDHNFLHFFCGIWPAGPHLSTQSCMSNSQGQETTLPVHIDTAHRSRPARITGGPDLDPPVPSSTYLSLTATTTQRLRACCLFRPCLTRWPPVRCHLGPRTFLITRRLLFPTHPR